MLGYLSLIFFIVLLFLMVFTFAWGGWSAAPWVPLWKKDIRRMLTLAKVKPGELVYDLGAGDGRMIIIAAKEFGAKAVGFEVACLPYFLAWVKISLLGLFGQARLVYKNFFLQDLSQADVIMVFLTPPAMEKLKPKFEKETKPSCRIVSYAFSIPGWQPTIKDKPDNKTGTVYVYQR
jgi:tRNA A58 N-methylase Trm61